jgi:hypothetical protein
MRRREGSSERQREEEIQRERERGQERERDRQTDRQEGERETERDRERDRQTDKKERERQIGKEGGEGTSLSRGAHQPSLPRKSMISTCCLSNLGTGQGMPTVANRLRFLISFSAQVRTIFLGLDLQ